MDFREGLPGADIKNTGDESRPRFLTIESVKCAGSVSRHPEERVRTRTSKDDVRGQPICNSTRPNVPKSAM